MFGQQLVEDLKLGRVLGGNAVSLRLLGQGVGHTVIGREKNANLGNVGGGDPALPLEILPGHVIALGADQGKDILLATILAHKSRGQTKASAGLKLGGDTEHGRGQEMDLVVDDQSPVALIE